MDYVSMRVAFPLHIDHRGSHIENWLHSQNAFVFCEHKAISDWSKWRGGMVMTQRPPHSNQGNAVYWRYKALCERHWCQATMVSVQKGQPLSTGPGRLQISPYGVPTTTVMVGFPRGPSGMRYAKLHIKPSWTNLIHVPPRFSVKMSLIAQCSYCSITNIKFPAQHWRLNG